jgi:hypothetical protein
VEGFWNPSEAEGGAKLLVGPSVHLRSRGGHWTASATAGPVFRSSYATLPDGARLTSRSGGRHYGMFASASWRLARGGAAASAGVVVVVPPLSIRSPCSDMDARVKPASSCDTAMVVVRLSSSPGYSWLMGVRTAVEVTKRDDLSL